MSKTMTLDELNKVIKFSDPNPSCEIDWHNFQGGKEITSDKIDGWIKECLEEIQKQIVTDENPYNPSSYVASGNTIVTCVAYKQPDDLYEITVVVAKDYQSTIISDFDPNLNLEFVKVD
jgi:hypothetical protein